MPISSKTSNEFAADLEEAIISRNSSYDTKIGPIPDLVINPLAGVLEVQNERIRVVQQLLSLTNNGMFTDSDLDDFVYNELLVRMSGAKSQVVLTFSRQTLPLSDVTVRAGFPVATLPDEDSDAGAVTYNVVSDTTLVSANASSYFNPTTQKYELQVLAEAVVSGEYGNVGQRRISRPLRPLVGFDSVINNAPATGGTDIESNDRLIERYYLSLVGTSPAVSTGLNKIVFGQFNSVSDIHIVYGDNPLNIRAASDAGAVDAYVIGELLVVTTETIVFTGPEQVIKLKKQPVITVSAITPYTAGIDYEFVRDTSGNAGSTRGADGIKFLSTGSTPTVGSTVSVTYTYNALMGYLDVAFLDPNLHVPGRDLLYKAGIRVDTTLSANIKLRSGFSSVQVVTSVTNAIINFINSLKLNDDVEVSDLQRVVRSYNAVDNFVITNFAKLGDTGTSDIPIGANEYARINSANITLTVI